MSIPFPVSRPITKMNMKELKMEISGTEDDILALQSMRLKAETQIEKNRIQCMISSRQSMINRMKAILKERERKYGKAFAGAEQTPQHENINQTGKKAGEVQNQPAGHPEYPDPKL